jgi:hypothetical protein
MTEGDARVIIRRISDAAIELAFIRHDLCDEDGEELDIEHIKQDIFNCLVGDDTGCNLPDELDEQNCERIWLQRTF